MLNAIIEQTYLIRENGSSLLLSVGEISKFVSKFWLFTLELSMKNSTERGFRGFPIITP